MIQLHAHKALNHFYKINPSCPPPSATTDGVLEDVVGGKVRSTGGGVRHILTASLSETAPEDSWRGGLLELAVECCVSEDLRGSVPLVWLLAVLKAALAACGPGSLA